MAGDPRDEVPFLRFLATFLIWVAGITVLVLVAVAFF